MKRADGVQVKKSSAGLGLFATKEFNKDDEVVEYTGEKITVEESNNRGGKYLATLNEEWVLDGKDRKHVGRYINHSCKPNCFFEVDEEEKHIYAVALRKISIGEELTVHYGKDYFEEHIEPVGCKCQYCATK